MNTRFYDIGRHFLRPFYNLFWPSKVTGEENIPDEGGFILCANHVHMRDPLFLAVRLPKRHFTFLAKAELFKNPLLRLVIGEKGLGAIPISRGHSDLGAIREALKAVSYEGVTGSIVFDENGDADKDTAYIKGVDNATGEFTFVKMQTVADLENK